MGIGWTIKAQEGKSDSIVVGSLKLKKVQQAVLQIYVWVAVANGNRIFHAETY